MTFVEGCWAGRQDFEDTQRAAIVAKGRDENRTYAQAPTTGEINARIALGVVAEHDLAGADGFGGNTRVGLQADAEIRSRAPGAGAADDFVAVTERNRRPCRPRQVLGPLGNGADCRLEIEFAGVDLSIFGYMRSTKAGSRMRGIRQTKLIPLRQQGHPGTILVRERIGN